MIIQFLAKPLPSFAAITAPVGMRALREMLRSGKYCEQNPLEVELSDFVQEGPHKCKLYHVWYNGLNRAIIVQPVRTEYTEGDRSHRVNFGACLGLKIITAEDGTITRVNKAGWVADPNAQIPFNLLWEGADPIEQSLAAETAKMCAVFGRALEMCPRTAVAPTPWVLNLEAEKAQNPCSRDLVENEAVNRYELPSDDDTGCIVVLRRSLYEMPLNNLGLYVATMWPMFRPENPVLLDHVPVIFVSDQINDVVLLEDGVDGGGPTQDYVKSLWTGIIAHGMGKQFVPVADIGSPLIPQASTGCNEGSGLPNPLSDGEKAYYEHIGKIMMCAYISHDERYTYCMREEGPAGLFPITIGCHFDMSLFNAIQKLTVDQTEPPFDELPIEEQAKILESLLPEGTSVYVTEVMLPFLQGEEVDLQRVVAHVIDPEIAQLATQGSIADFKRGVLKELLLNLNEGKLAKSIAPIQAIAMGMVAFCTRLSDPGRHTYNEIWETKIQSVPPLEFVTKIQGSLDKNVIAAKIICSVPDDPEVSKKTQWLQEWILDEQTTNGQRIAFLKFATGASSISAKPIRVTRQGRPSPLPDVHTCADEQLHLSPLSHLDRDDTKENFIRTLLGAMPDAGEAFLVL